MTATAIRRCNPLSFTLLVIACSAFSAFAQATTYPLRFREHSYNISAAGAGGYNSWSVAATVSLPFHVTRVSGEAYSGTLEIRFPNALPDGQPAGIAGAEDYLILSSPVTLSVNLAFDWTSPPSAHGDEWYSWNMDLEMRSNRYDDSTNQCKVTIPLGQVKPGTTTHFEQEFPCTFPKVRADFFQGQYWNARIETFIDFTTYSSDCGICGFMASVYSNYDPVPPSDLQVRRIVVTQPVQDDNNTYPLVAGKNTVARVFVKTANDDPSLPAIADVKATLRGFRGGAELPGSPLSPYNQKITAPRAPDANNTNDSLNFLLPTEWTRNAGSLTLRAEVNPDGSLPEPDRTNNTLETAINIQPSYPLNIQWIRVCFPDPLVPTGMNCPSPEIAASSGLMQKLYPVAEDGLTYTRFWRPTWLWSNAATLNDDAVVRQLAKLFDLTDLESPPDQLFAWLPPTRAVDGGYSDPLWDNGTGRVAFAQDLSGVDDEFVQTGEGIDAFLIAHELGHNFGLRHLNTRDGGSEDPDTDWTYPNARIQSSGFDADTMKVIDSWKFDLMSYRCPQAYAIWVSGFHYGKLVNSQMQPSHKRAAGNAAVPFMVISGSARSDSASGTLDPIYRLTASFSPPTSNPAGNHCVQFLGAAGKLSDFCFDLAFQDQNGRNLQSRAFALKLPVPDGTTAVALVRGSSELARRSASSHAPAVAFNTPAAGATWSGRQLVSWTASDADGDALRYALLYSADGGTSWIPIDLDFDSTDWGLNTAEIAGGSSVLFKVAATDGFHTAEATAGPITINEAPIAELAASADFGTVKLGSEAERSLVLLNRGSGPLRVSAAESSRAGFHLADTVPLDVAAGESRQLKVRFSPDSEGLQSARLTLTTDDPDHQAVRAQLFGTGAGEPQIELSPAGVSFGSVPVGDGAGADLYIRNKGTGTLIVSAISVNDSRFSVSLSPLPAWIGPGSQVKATIGFRPASAVAHNATLAISTNLADSPTTAALSGVGTTGAAASCYQSLHPNIITKPAGGGNAGVTVTSPAGCPWGVASDVDWVIIDTSQGAGGGTVSLTIRPNSGPSRSGTLTIGTAALAIHQEGVAAKSVIPAVASLAGAYGSFFRTGLQLHNPFDDPISGTLVFHPSGATGTPTDPTMGYTLLRGETRYYEDLLPTVHMSGSASVDIRPRTGSFPVSIFRVFNDAGANGTTGMTEEQMDPGEALQQGETGVLIAPPEPSRARFQIGVRSFEYGATLEVAVRDAAGEVRTTTAKIWPPTYWGQQKGEEFVGIPLLANDAISVRVASGSAIVYGVVNDNTTQDPSLQFARPNPASSARRVIPVVASLHGAVGSFFRTALQLHNPTSSAIAGKLRFHPLGFGGSDADPAIDYSLQPGATASWDDVLTPFSYSGMGSLDIVPVTGPSPVAMARVFNDAGEKGTTGLGEESMGSDDSLQAGGTGVLIAPPDATQRYNIGLRTLDQGATVTFRVRNSWGDIFYEATKTYGANYFEQQSAPNVIGTAPPANGTVIVQVDSGSLIAYGVAVDNVTQDGSMQFVRPVR